MADLVFVLVILAAAIAAVAWYCLSVRRLERMWDQCERDLEAGFWSHDRKQEER